MLDFLKIGTRSKKRGVTEIYPKFIITNKSSDLMIRGGDFYAVWIEELGLWSTEEQDLLDIIDLEIDKFAAGYKDPDDNHVIRLYIRDAESGMIDVWHKYCQKQMRNSYKALDEKLIFSNTETTKADYASKRLPYPLEKCDTPGYEKLISTLYIPEERNKLEWAIGAVISGDSKNIQKFLVLYGSAGTGKSTILNIMQKLFEGYYSTFDAKALGSSSNMFALEAFKSNPLVAIQHDGDLSRIEDNTRLNSLVSHELMTVNEKFKSAYTNRFNAFLFLGTNRPVKITDAKSGLIRRLIDVSPSGNKVSAREYKKLVKQIDFELGGIATHCLDVYLANPGRYDDYIPTTMLGASNDFYNFVIDSFHVFKREDGTTLKAAWEMYNQYCSDAKVPYPYSQRNFKEELKNYFWDFKERFTSDDGSRIRSYYTGFRTDKFDVILYGEEKKKQEEEDDLSGSPLQLVFGSQPSIFDVECSKSPAQYATDSGTPMQAWDKVTTTLADLDTSRLHYVKVPKNHIVIDFDIKGDDGKKSFEKNLEAASKWPPTYSELSKSGAGIHLHYIYTGDPGRLSRVYGDDIEIKVFSGNSSLRRKLTKCNDLPIATISSGLPLKEEDKVINREAVQTEKGLRTTIKKCLNKEVHSGTRCNVDWINEILQRAYDDGLKYDVSDLKNEVYAFAAHSTNQAPYCLKVVSQMKFKSDEPSLNVDVDNGSIVFYDVEVFPNLFLVNYKLEGADRPVVRLINPSPSEIEELLRFRLVGFNCRRYDNHMLYGCLIGYSNEQLYKLSQRIISSKKGDKNNGMFGEAYNISYTDVYDYAAKKQSLKKWEIELGIHHQELGLPWDQPVPPEKWNEVAEYCDNDVIATEAVWNATQGDFTARSILAELAGGSVNDTTNSLTTKIIFGSNKKPNLVYTDLATGKSTDGTYDSRNEFPGYEFKNVEGAAGPQNMYRGTNLGYGGYVYAEPGMYGNVALLDVASLHPNSAIAMNCFGEYTQNFYDILQTRILIKHGEFDEAKKLFGGRLSRYLDDPALADSLSLALKIAINSVYGLTSASFDNPFRDIRNKNNIVALRGALFMKTLQDEVTARGFTVIHVKTDSIKIADATLEIIQFCMEFARQYGYTFEHEGTYDRICLVNNAVYIAKYASVESCTKLYGEEYVNSSRDTLKENKKHPGTWTATGAQFAVPYIFKKLFSREEIEFDDLCETKSVQTALYLDLNEKLPNVSALEDERDKLIKKYANKDGLPFDIDDEVTTLNKQIEEGHDYRFIGKVSSFCPIVPGAGGGVLLRQSLDKWGNIKYDSATGADGYRWLEAEMVRGTDKEQDIDLKYYDKLLNEAISGSGSGANRKPGIADFGDFEWFISDDPYIGPEYDYQGRPIYYPFEVDDCPFDVR